MSASTYLKFQWRTKRNWQVKPYLVILWAGLLFAVPSFAQQEMNNWYFGYNAGLTFQNGVAEPISGGNIFSGEGCASVSDQHGQLLFYTDGIRVWNRMHALINSNLSGDTIAAQSSLIVKVPGSDYQYYLFSVGAAENDNGALSYSIIDMQLNNGLGDIVPGTANTLLVDGTCEKVAAVKHHNTNDVWLITHLFNSDQFLVFKINCQGISASPQRFNIGSVVDGQVGNAIGYLKVSPDGSYLAIANFRGEVDVFNFNNYTGAISNARKIGVNPGRVCRSYGVEFSPDSKWLYVSSIYNCGDVGEYDIDQYQVDAVDLNTSRVNLVHGFGNAPGALQLGSDNRIYIAYNNSSYIGAILYPDLQGLACTLQENFLQLPAGAKSGLGLPNAIAGFTRTLLAKDTSFCEVFTYTSNIPLENTTYLWNTGSTSESITVNQYGSYWVEITTSDGCIYNDTINISKHNYDGAYSLGNDTALCEGSTLLLDVSQAGDSYKWQDNSTASTFLVSSAGQYSVQVNNDGCHLSDTIEVSFKSIPKPYLGADLLVCPEQTLVLDPGVEEGSITWENGATGGNRVVDKEGLYQVSVTNECGTGTDEIVVSLALCPQNIPNAFTPARTTNREFKMSNGYGLAEFRMQVFNRWGQLIFESRDPLRGWDGKKNGVLQPPGTYAYVVSFISAVSKQRSFYKGAVMLIL